MSSKRYSEIDIARGIGILLVVLGHSLKQTEMDTTGIRVLDCLIYSFHMPLFFVLSGFVSVRVMRMKDIGERLEYIKGRAVRLLVPYFAIGLIYIPVKLKLADYAVKPFTAADIAKILIGQNPDVSLWFLYVLFVICAITGLFVNEVNFRSIWYGTFALCAASWWVNIPLRTPKYLFFFLTGIWLRLKVEDTEKDGSGPLLEGQTITAVLSLAAFIIFNRYYFRTGISILRLPASVCGIFLTLWFSSLLDRKAKNARLTRSLRYLGLISMDIYILHEPVMTAAKILFWYNTELDYIPCTILIFLCAVLIPIPVSKWIIRKVPVLRLLLFGEKKKAGKAEG